MTTLTNELTKEDGELWNEKVPAGAQFEELRKAKLVVEKTEQGGTLEFKTTWNQQRIDKWLRSLFPKAFEWLDKQHPIKASERHWKLLRKRYTTLYIVDPDELTGDDLYTSRGPAARNYRDYSLRFGTN